MLVDPNEGELVTLLRRAPKAEPAIGARRRRRARERGQALVEFAVVGVAFFLLVFGIFDFARFFESWITVQHAARDAARYAITGQVNCSGLTNDRTGCIVKKAKAATTGLYRGGPSGADVSVSYQSWAYQPASDNWSSGATSNSAGSQCDAIMVTVTYTHRFVFPVLQALAPSGITLTGKQRMVNEPFGPCI
jgi:Flp pilus assembly protein TadG